MRKSTKFIAALLLLIVIAGFSIPTLPAGQGQQQPPVERATIGTFWWYRGDGGLIYAQPDAEGFAQAMEDDGCMWNLNINDVNGVEDLIDDHLEDTASELIDDVELAYFVGHSGSTALGIHKPFPLLGDRPFVNDPEYAEAKYCKWGDDGPLKWVVLATCQAGNENFASALQGINLILGWRSVCDDWIYGPVFAEKIIEGKTLKQAWFETAEECQHVSGIATVLGENYEAGYDHLKGYGSYCNPEVDDYYTIWEYPVNGWQELYNWIAPTGYIGSDWIDEWDAYDDNTGSCAVFRETQNGFSDPLVLRKSGDPVSIRGFRIMPSRDVYYSDHVQIPWHDEMELKFYLDGQWKTTVTITQWEGGSWRIIDFNDEDTQCYTTIVGDEQPEVDEVRIRFHENDPLFGFAVRQIKVFEFDFWEVGDPGSGGGSGGGGDGDNGSKPGSSGLEFIEESAVSESMSSEELGMSQSIGMGLRGIDESKPSTDYAAYTVIPDAYDPDQFASVAQTVGLKGAPTNTDNAYLLTGENGKSLSYNTEKGVWRYVNPSKAYPTATRNPRLPSDGEAVALATAFMDKNGFSSDTIVDAVVTYQKQGEGIKGTDTILYEWIITKNVYFKHEVNGLPILDKTTVTIGEGGTIAAFTLPTHTVELTET